LNTFAVKNGILRWRPILLIKVKALFVIIGFDQRNSAGNEVFCENVILEACKVSIL
jgi:hypothetical protein